LSKFDPSLEIVKASSERLLPSREFIGLLLAVLEKGADFRLRAKGLSMRPFICDGDIITIARPGELAVGQIVAAEQPESGKLVIHRIIASRRGRVLIKGDANPQADGWVKMEKILGIVSQVQRGEKKIESSSAVKRRLIAFVSRQRFLRRVRFSIYKRLLYSGKY